MNYATVRTLAVAVPTGAVIGTAAFRAPALLMLAAVAAAGLLLGRKPALLLGTFLLVDQTYESTAYFGEIGPLVTTGHQLYEPIKGVSPALLLLLLGLVMALHSGRGRPAIRVHAHGFDGVGVALSGLLLWTGTASVAQESADFSGGTMLRIATNTLSASLPWVLALLAYALAVRLLREPGGRSALARVIAAALFIKGALGIVVLLTTKGAVIDGQEYVVYYDAALPMVAGMAIIGFLLASDRDVPWRKLLIVVAGTIVVFSFRRSVWSAMAVAILVLPVIRMRTAILKRLVAGAGVLLLCLLVMPASVRQSAFGRVGSAVSVAQGTGDEHSAANHKKDLQLGYAVAAANPWLGLGVRAPQHPAFAYQDITRVYVHNDPLQVWLRFGLPGLMFFLMLLAVLCGRGVARLRRSGPLSVLDAGCATFAVVCSVAVMPAPFISDTVRWPVLVAVVAAVLRTSATDARSGRSESQREQPAAGPAPMQQPALAGARR